MQFYHRGYMGKGCNIINSKLKLNIRILALIMHLNQTFNKTKALEKKEGDNWKEWVQVRVPSNYLHSKYNNHMHHMLKWWLVLKYNRCNSKYNNLVGIIKINNITLSTRIQELQLKLMMENKWCCLLKLKGIWCLIKT